MALTDLLKATAQQEDITAAHALASHLNNDQVMRKALGGKSEFTATDVIRLGRNILSYLPRMPHVDDLDTEIRAAAAEAVGATEVQP